MTEGIRIDARDAAPTIRGEQGHLLAALLAYFAAHLLIQMTVTGSLERDEAEIVYLTQRLQLGYGTQPPLYAWLQWLAFSMFGLNLFALALLKVLILLALYLGMYRAARPLIGVHGALAAAASLVLFPQIGWESLRDLTHSVLLTSVACSTLWCYFAVLRKPGAGRYALFGLLVGLGLQTKYNFGIFLTGLVCASLLVREHRDVLWNRKVVIAAGAAFLVFLPHGAWLMQNLDAAAAGTVRKLAEGTGESGYLNNVGAGLASLLSAVLAFAVPPVLVYIFALRRLHKQIAFDLRAPESRFFLCLYASFLALLVAIVLTGEVGKIKDRWMMPLLFSLPLALFAVAPRLSRQAAFERLRPVVVAVGLLVLILLPIRTWFGPALGKIAPPHHPYPELASELVRRFPATTTVVTEGTLIAGNLHFEQPRLRTLLLEHAIRSEERLAGQVLLVMGEDATIGWLDRFRSAYPQAKVTEQGRIRLGYRFGGKGSMTFDYVHLNVEDKNAAVSRGSGNERTG
ncbi:glycosyltransferase family 39 protein [Massilia timonae]|uniref:glycosyltransferase family 39 protein n=1 Tax=Massilia timonae TaxID=47229 RepID=UPI001621BD44|nr:glycosyltransferase family 39 protein [Massilia timonae]